MKLDLEELQRGIEKEAGLGDLIQGAKNLFTGGGGNIMSDLGNMATQILPIAMAFGAKKKAPTVKLPTGPKPLFPPSGNVASFATMSKAGEKKANFLDMGMLKTMLTMRAANGIVDAAQGKSQAQPQSTTQPKLEENPKQLELVSRYPEINKMLADPQSREYLESLLTKDTAYGS